MSITSASGLTVNTLAGATRWLRLALSWTTASLAVASVPAVAEDWTRTLAVTTAFSDNVDRASASPRSDLAYIGEVGFSYQRDSGRLTADIDANYRYLGYARDTFDRQGYPGLAGIVDLRILPERFSWHLEDEYGQVAPSPFGALNPLDTQDVNYLTTGPTINLPLGALVAVNFTAEYSATDYSVSDIDNQQIGGTGQLVRRWGASRYLSLNYSRQKIDYDRNDLYQDYFIDKAFMRLESSVRRTSFAIDVGSMTYELEHARRNTPLLAATAYRQIGTRTRIGIDYFQGYSDSAEAFRLDRLGGASPTEQDVIVEAGPSRSKQASGFVMIGTPRFTSQVSIHYGNEEFEQNPASDRRIRGLAVEASLQMSPRTSLNAFGSIENFNERLLDDDVDDTFVGLGLVYQLTAYTKLELKLVRYERNSNLGEDFAENRVSLTWQYRKSTLVRPPAYDPFRGRGVPLPGAMERNRTPVPTSTP